MSVLPESVRGFVEVIGHAAAMRLVQAFPGITIVVPKGRHDMAMRERLVNLLGAAEAAAFMSRYGGERITVPRCAALLRAERDRGIVSAYGAGTPAAELARQHGLSERQVWNILGQPLPDPEVPAEEPAWMRNQLKLFDEASTPNDQPA